MADALEALHDSSERLRRIVGGLDPQQLRQPAYPTEWSIADVLSHIGSGAVILGRRFEDVVHDRDTDPDFNQSVWDAWNAKDPDAQAKDALEADAAFVAALEGLDDDARRTFAFSMGPFHLDFAGFVVLRLNEHALHTWDVEVAVDVDAVLPNGSTAVLVDNLQQMAGLVGKPTGVERTVHVSTDAPERRFVVAVGTDSLELSPSAPSGGADLVLPAEAFVRLVYGRLDPDHAPPVDDGPLLDQLRRVFPGF